MPLRSASKNIPIIASSVPNPEQLVVLSEPFLTAIVRIGELLQDCPTKWAFGGDAAEIMLGVNIQPDHLSIITTRKGLEEIGKRLENLQIQPIEIMERSLDRTAEINGEHYKVQVRSYASAFRVNGQRLDVHGDLQIRVGEWAWGDPIDYDAEYVRVLRNRIPVIPLSMKSELYLGLGWTDRVRKINEALKRKHHTFA